MSNDKSTKPGKRQMYLAPRVEKVLAVRRVLNGESKAHVRRTTGIPEATLRGWCKTTEIIAAAKCVDDNDETTPPPPVAPLVLARVERYNKIKTNSQNGASTSGTTESSDRPSSGKKLANRRHKTRTGSENGSDSGVADLSDASNSNDSSINKSKRAAKRKRTHTESTDDDDVPAKRRIVDVDEKVTYSSESQQVNDLELQNGKDLLYDLFARDIITRDLFIYFWETIKSLKF